mmetsp:Transcript_41040/g.136626  ORF Transcript_41040/g.136626 Transcript_41040/m.136626 type:complete len:227 (+) Transcript_41040:589-1269(+)
MPFLARHVCGRPLVAHAHVDDVAASREQPLDAAAVAGRCREVERQQLGRIAVAEERLHRRPAEQLCDRTLACLQRSVVQRGVLLRVRDGGVGVGREQQSQQLDVPHGGGDVQRGAAVAVLRVLVTAMLHQQRAHLRLLFARGVAEGGAAEAVGGRRRERGRAALEQHLQQATIARVDGEVEEGRFVRHGRLPEPRLVAVEQPPHRLRLAGRRCGLQLCPALGQHLE